MPRTVHRKTTVTELSIQSTSVSDAKRHHGSTAFQDTENKTNAKIILRNMFQGQTLLADTNNTESSHIHSRHCKCNTAWRFCVCGRSKEREAGTYG